jgi:hypothetical protein
MLNEADLWLRGATHWQPRPALTRGKQAWSQPGEGGDNVAAVVKVQGAVDTDSGTALRLLRSILGTGALVEHLSDASDVVTWRASDDDDDDDDLCLLRQW